MKKLLYTLSLCLMLASCVSDEVPSTGDLAGIVKDRTTSETLQGCLVTLTPGGKSTTTGTDGRYEFKSLQPETYSIEFSKDGYEAERKNVVVVAGESTTADVMLTKQGQSLLLSEEALDFGDLDTSKILMVSLSGSNTLSIAVKANAAWLKVTPESGTVSRAGLKLTVIVDREGLSAGDFSSSITITSSLGTTEVPVRMKVSVASAPEISNSGDFYEIGETSFKVNALIKATGGAVITRYGHCWAEKAEPTVDDQNTNFGTTSEVGEFTSTVSGLTSGQTYYVRAYAENKNGISYSPTRTITMPKVDLPTVITQEATQVKTTTASLNGSVTDNGGADITECGFYYGTTDHPNTKVKAASVSNNFAVELSALEEGKTYYFKAYAVNTKGEATGDVKSFTTNETGNEPWDGNAANSFAGGTGTMVDPFIIETPAQLAFIEESGKKNAYFKLKNNIDLDNKAWGPITAFNGHFDGNGKTISNLRVARQQDKAGLFGEVRNGEVKNLTLKNVSINLPECECIGGIVGNCYMGNIDNCHVMMDGASVIVGKKNVGGIVGCFVSDEYSKTTQPITRCSVNSSSKEYTIRGTENVGGIVGMTDGHSWNSSVKIEDCRMTGNIGGDSNVGGIAGYMYKYLSAVSITRCSFDGNLMATQYVGGMVGQSQGYSTGQSTVVSSSKAVATITADKGYAGGMIGFAKDLYDIQSCYAIMNFDVGGTAQNIGGLIGYQLWNYSGGCSLSCSYAVTEFSLQLSKTGGIIGYSMEGELNITDCCTTWNVAGSYSGRGRTKVTNTFTDCVGTDIITIFNDSGSKYLSNWNLRNTFTVSATVSGSKQNVACPRLSWED